MRVSVIIPNFNNAIYLGQCIDSVVNQGFDLVKEIIIVDDHSTDASWDILLKYKKKEPNKIFVFKNPNKGVQSARNYGYKKSSGEYIQWLDSDDILGPNKIRNQLKQLENKNSNIVSFCGWVHFSDNINDFIPKQNFTWKNYQNPLDFLVETWTLGSMIQTSCWLTPRKICDKISWDNKWLINQDGVYFMDVLLNCESIIFSLDSIVYYRLPSGDNISRKKNELVLNNLFSSYKYYEKILDLRDTYKTRNSLAVNYANFLAYIYPDYKDLQETAKKQIKLLGLKKIPNFGGKRFQILRFFLGLGISLKLSKLYNTTKRIK